MYEIIVSFFAILIGLILGLIGAGGTIITLPVLVYLIRIPPLIATSYSLFIVGITSFLGLIIKIKEGNIDLKTGIYFSIPSLLSVYFTRKLLIPIIPEIIFEYNTIIIHKNSAIMILFSFLMFFSAISMMELKKTPIKINRIKNNIFNLSIEGVLIGLLTALVGAGGGFIIIPTLVLFSGLSMKEAVGTSLMIISIKSLIGFIADLSNSFNINWIFLLNFSLLSLIGMYLGIRIGRKIEGDNLKKKFGYFILIISIFILFKEIL